MTMDNLVMPRFVAPSDSIAIDRFAEGFCKLGLSVALTFALPCPTNRDWPPKAAFYFLGPEAVLYHLLDAILALGKQHFHDKAD